MLGLFSYLLDDSDQKAVANMIKQLMKSLRSKVLAKAKSKPLAKKRANMSEKGSSKRDAAAAALLGLA
eukprot:1934241-Amphidinium_carterae.2